MMFQTTNLGAVTEQLRILSSVMWCSKYVCICWFPHHVTRRSDIVRWPTDWPLKVNFDGQPQYDCHYYSAYSHIQKIKFLWSTWGSLDKFQFYTQSIAPYNIKFLPSATHLFYYIGIKKDLTPPMSFRNSWSQAWLKEGCVRLGEPTQKTAIPMDMVLKRSLKLQHTNGPL
jgi:hypothetical protein